MVYFKRGEGTQAMDWRQALIQRDYPSPRSLLAGSEEAEVIRYRRWPLLLGPAAEQLHERYQATLNLFISRHDEAVERYGPRSQQALAAEEHWVETVLWHVEQGHYGKEPKAWWQAHAPRHARAFAA